jgi:uncharacterized protein DUF4231
MTTGQRGRAQAPKLPSLWERLEAQIAWYDRKASANQRAYKVSKISIVALGILIPVIAEYGHIPGFEGSPAFLVGVAAGAIVLLEGLQVVNKWQENWILYRATCEGLRNERHLMPTRRALTQGSSPTLRTGCSPSGPAA